MCGAGGRTWGRPRSGVGGWWTSGGQGHKRQDPAECGAPAALRSMAVEQISSDEVASSSRRHMVLGVRRLARQLAARIWPLRRLQAPLSLAWKDALPCSLERLLGAPFLVGCWAEALLGSRPRRPLREAAHRTAAYFSGARQREGHRRASKGDSGTEVSAVGRCDTPLPWLQPVIRSKALVRPHSRGGDPTGQDSWARGPLGATPEGLI